MLDEFSEKRATFLHYTDAIINYAKYDGKLQVAAEFSKIRDELAMLRYNIAIMGFMNRGKSTLINAVLGRRDDDIAPIDIEVCSSAIVEYTDTDVIKDTDKYIKDLKDEGGALVRFKGDNQEPQKIFFNEIRDYVTEQGNEGNNKNVDKVTVYGNFPLLNKAAIMIDTPGKGAIYKYHDTLLQEFLPVADAIIFLISANLPLQTGEIAFLRELRDSEKKNIFFVLTKVDKVVKEDMPEVRKFVRDNIMQTGLNAGKIYEISAKELFDAYRKNLSEEKIKEIRASSGMDVLLREIEAHIQKNSDKNHILKKRVEETLQRAYSFCTGMLQLVEEDLSKFTKDIFSLETEAQQLKTQGEQLRTDQAEAISEFSRMWERQVKHFMRSIQSKKRRITDQIQNSLDNKNLLDNIFGSMRLTEMVQNHVQEECSEAVSELNAKLEDIADKLKKGVIDSIDIYISRTMGSPGVSDKAVGVGGALAGGAGAYLAYSSVVGIPGAISASWSAYVAACGVVQTTGPAIGFVAKTWAWLWGTGAVPAAGKGAAALAAKSTALTAAIGTTISGVATAGLAFGAVWLGAKVINATMKGLDKSRIPDLVNEMIEATSKNVGVELDNNKNGIIEMYKEIVEDLIRQNEEKSAQVITAIKNQDPTMKKSLEEKRDRLLEYLAQREKLSLSLIG